MWRPCVGLVLCNLVKGCQKKTGGTVFFFGSRSFETYFFQNPKTISGLEDYFPFVASIQVPSSLLGVYLNFLYLIVAFPLHQHFMTRLWTKVFVGRKPSWSVCS